MGWTVLGGLKVLFKEPKDNFAKSLAQESRWCGS